VHLLKRPAFFVIAMERRNVVVDSLALKFDNMVVNECLGQW
jgi:hypothetical protein